MKSSEAAEESLERMWASPNWGTYKSSTHTIGDHYVFWDIDDDDNKGYDDYDNHGDHNDNDRRISRA